MLLLARRYEQYVARTGQSSLGNNEAPAAAVRSALLYVQQYNAHALLSGAQTAAAEAWMQLVEVSSTRQYEQLGPALPGTSPAEKLLEVLMASLEVGEGGGRDSLLGGKTDARQCGDIAGSWLEGGLQGVRNTPAMTTQPCDF
jgi:hypothetical protein